jgi:hypothetical protein
MKVQVPSIINATGKQEILEFLVQNHKLANKLNDENINAWARDAENQLSMGNPPSIEIRSWESVHGYTQEYTVSEGGVDFQEFDIED